MSKLADPQWRKDRAKKAALAARRKHEAKRLEIGERYATKGHAYAAGYRLGYQRAMQYWLWKFQAEGRRKGA